MPAKRKRTEQKADALYRVSYIVGANWGMSGGPSNGTKEIRASSWASVDGLITFYGSGPVFVLPERLLVSIEKLG